METVADQIYCDWEQADFLMEDETWLTTCGNLYILLEGGPKDNDYNFCPGCGRHIREL